MPFKDLVQLHGKLADPKIKRENEVESPESLVSVFPFSHTDWFPEQKAKRKVFKMRKQRQREKRGPPAKPILVGQHTKREGKGVAKQCTLDESMTDTNLPRDRN